MNPIPDSQAERPLDPLQGFAQDEALRDILEGTAGETGERFFEALVKSLSHALHTRAAWVTEWLPEARRLRALAFWMEDKYIVDYEYAVDGSPCEDVVDRARFVHVSENLLELYPRDPELEPLGAFSYMGLPLQDAAGQVVGLLAAIDSRPMPEEPRAEAIFRIFAARAAAELNRLRAERDLAEREEKLHRIVAGAMDAIIELDREFRVTMLNPAAERLLSREGTEALGQDFTEWLADTSHGKFESLARHLDKRPFGHRYVWIPGGLEMRHANGATFPAEATLSRYEMHREPFYTLVLRDANERLASERTIESLTGEREYLREELLALGNFGEIVGRSEPLLRVLADVKQVAPTDTTVLIVGETGTGKELIARAIHKASARRDNALITVNCAAIPATLIESEFFGHEAGAFTGATRRRQGRFELADHGTIFLDEIGELPIELQAKLLRVLQEGEYEPVGGSRTRKVDVRVVAATHRDLRRAVAEGRFREDLYYRLHVFPVEVPPLRDRGDDVVLLAESFARRFAQKMGRVVEPVSIDDRRRLKGYDWPGNIRELQNVIERAVITSSTGRLNLSRALPETMPPAAPCNATDGVLPKCEQGSSRILTVGEMEEGERRNLMLALEQCGWRVAGESGAATLLGMPPSTLSSRMKTLGIARPPRP